MTALIKLLCLLLPNPWRKIARDRWTSWYLALPVRARAARVGKNLCVRGVCKVSKHTYIGDEVSLKDFKVEGDGECRIGSYVHAGREILILTANHDYRGDFLPYGDGFALKRVEIGDCVWLGTRTTILPGTKIGEGSIIQAGSVVHGEIPPFAIAGGNPAKVFAMRNVEKCKRLLAEGKFMPHTKGW